MNRPMTKREAATYQRRMTAGRIKANELGQKLGKQIKDKVRKAGETEKNKIDSIYTPLVLEPIISNLDYAFDELGQSNFEWVIDLYIGRKCGKIIPLLLQMAEKLNEAGNNNKENKAEGGGADHYIWLEHYLHGGLPAVNVEPNNIEMRWETQNFSYYISLTKNYGSWKLDVAEYDWNKPRQPPEFSWKKEPGHVLEYKSFHLDDSKIDDHRVKDAWTNLVKIYRFFSLINPFCTALEINLYKKENDE